MSRHTYRADVTVDDEGDAVTLVVELEDDRSISLTYYKNERWPTWVFLSRGGATWEFDKEQITAEEFEDWVKIAVGAMPPERAWTACG